MTDRSVAASSHGPAVREGEMSRVYGEGIVAGLLGAATVAVWFLIVDSVNGRPFYTPTVLGTALFRGGAGLEAGPSLPVSFEMVLLFTWVHCLVFAALGGIVARLLAFAEHTANVGFGIVLLFVVFEFGFVAVTMIFAENVLRWLAWPAVLVGNLLAAAVMAGYFWRRHPELDIEP